MAPKVQRNYFPKVQANTKATAGKQDEQSKKASQTKEFELVEATPMLFTWRVNPTT